MKSKKAIIVASVLLAMGLIGAGYSVGRGIYLARSLSRSLTVKGLAEMDVKSDLAIWDINFREVGNDLIQLDQKLQHDQELVAGFLKEQGFNDTEIARMPLRVEDRFANIYNSTGGQDAPNQRYVVTGGTRVRTNQVELVAKSVSATDKLLQQGIPLAFDVSSLSPNPSFYYTDLDKVRPSMMAEATKSARVLAEQFAKDADCHLAGIQRASQGVFQIMSRDTSTMSSDWSSNESALGTIHKKVRLVTTVDYRLK